VNQNGEADRTVHHIGIEVHGGSAVILIPAGSRTPVARAMTFTTVSDGQGAVEIRVVRCAPGSGEVDAARGCATSRPSGVVGRLLVPGLRRAGRGEARIDIGISLDREGVIRAWGSDRHTGSRQEAAFPGLWALPPRSRAQAAARLAGAVAQRLDRPLPGAADLQAEGRLLREHAVDGGALLAVLAGEIDALQRGAGHLPTAVR
jgi:hypothetical protein